MTREWLDCSQRQTEAERGKDESGKVTMRDARTHGETPSQMLSLREKRKAPLQKNRGDTN
jgi:hypothetical protein